jgi:hypothetical protein
LHLPMPASSAMMKMRRVSAAQTRHRTIKWSDSTAHCGSNLDEYDIFAHLYLYCRQMVRAVHITETAPLRTPPISPSTSERTGRQSIPDDKSSIHMKTEVS